MHGFFKILLQEELTGQVPEWSEGIDPEAHIRWCFNPKTMLNVAMAASVGATAMQASSTFAAGGADQKAAQARQVSLEHQATQSRQNAGQERAAAQRSANEQRRQAQLLESKALARAAGSGAGGPGVEKIVGDIGAEGEFRALSDLFIGEERARGLEHQADIGVFEGDQERRAGDIERGASKRKAITQVLGGGATLYGKYG